MHVKEDAGVSMAPCRWSYLAPALALPDLGLQRVDLVLGLLQLANTLTCSALVAPELTLLLVNQLLKNRRNHNITANEENTE